MKRLQPYKALITICLCLIISMPSQAANIIAKLDRNPVTQDETFHLIYEADSDVDGKPDFSAIYKDFEVLNSSQSTNMRMINGNYSLKKSWDLTLIGNKPGVFTIPSIPFGRDYSPSLQVTVNKAASRSGSTNHSAGSTHTEPDIFVEVESSTKSAYVESEIIFIARLVRNMEISQGSFSELETDDPDAIIINLGNYPQYEVTRGGKRYVVNEVRYAIYPQHSGTLRIKPLLFQARINSNNSRNLFDQFFQAGKIKRLRTIEMEINIEPKPTSIKTRNWLPLKDFSIEEEWSADLNNINVGDPITRTLTLSAKGFTGEQLPDLSFDDLDNLKQYPDQAVTENNTTMDGIHSRKQIKVAMIPTRAGKYTLPAINIPWWNTKTDKMEVASIPETTITATGVTSSFADDSSITTADSIITTPEKQPMAVTQVSAGYWPWISLLLATGWVMTLLFTFYKLRSKPVSPAHEKNRLDIRPLAKAVKKACSADDAATAKTALIQWGRAYWDEKTINSLADISQRVNIELSDAIATLNSLLYSPKKARWSGAELQREFERFCAHKRNKKAAASSVLEPLYK